MYDFESTVPVPFTGSAITSAGEGDFIIFLLHTCTSTWHIIIIIIVLYAVCFSSASTAPASKQLIIYIVTP